MNIQERIEALETEFAEKIIALKAEVEREDEEQEFPQDGDEYCYVDSDGDVLHDEWGGFASEEGMLKIGNVFKTKEQAEFAVEKLKVEAELRKFSRKFVWREENWILSMDAFEDIFLGYENDEINQGVIYFGSEDKALEAIGVVGKERIKKYIFGVEGLIND